MPRPGVRSSLRARGGRARRCILSGPALSGTPGPARCGGPVRRSIRLAALPDGTGAPALVGRIGLGLRVSAARRRSAPGPPCLLRPNSAKHLLRQAGDAPIRRPLGAFISTPSAVAGPRRLGLPQTARAALVHAVAGPGDGSLLGAGADRVRAAQCRWVGDHPARRGLGAGGVRAALRGRLDAGPAVPRARPAALRRLAGARIAPPARERARAEVRRACSCRPALGRLRFCVAA